MNIYGSTEDLNLHLVKINFMDDFLKKFDSVKGFLAHEEGIFLYELTKEFCLQNCAVEIGSYCGKSACYIGQACKENKTKLFTIDHHRGSEEQQFGEEYFDPDEYDYTKKRVDTLPSLKKNLESHDLIESINIVVGHSKQIANEIQGNLDLVFIDGSHTFESARNDYATWKDKIRAGGILAIHDIYDSELEGGQAPREIYEKALTENFVLLKRVNSLVALQKII
jgi:predicted O-methyltransferase YrrM